MKVRVQYNWTEIWEINPESLPDPEMASMRTVGYCPEKDEKWLKFCKDHKFPTNANGKVYDLYLRMCGAGLI